MSGDSDDRFPRSGQCYREIEIFAFQGPERVAQVKRDIDVVHDTNDPRDLMILSGRIDIAPEARLLAGAKVRALSESARQRHQPQPAGVDLELLGAHLAGVDSWQWASQFDHCSLLDPGPPPLHTGLPQPVRRETPLPDRHG